MRYTKSLSKVGENDLRGAGQKALDLVHLRSQGIRVPETFVILGDAFAELVQENKLKHKIDFLLQHLDPDDKRSFMNVYTSVRKAVTESAFPEGLDDELKEMFDATQGPLRILVSTNAPESAESNDTVIQNVQGWEELLTAVTEGWALAYLPSQLAVRTASGFEEDSLRIALLVQEMDTTSVSIHAYSSVPEDHDKVYLQVYYGYPDLRDRIKKDYYSITKDHLHTVASEIRLQENKLDFKDGELGLVPLNDVRADDKLIPRELEEIARLTKKAERILQNPVKAFYTTHEEDHALLWVNRLHFDIGKISAPKVEDPEEDMPEERFAKTEHAAQEAIKQATEQAETLRQVELDGSSAEKLLKASLNLAIHLIERQYEKTFGQEGDDFHDMIRELNSQNVFERPVKSELLRMAHDATQGAGNISDDDRANAIDEIVFMLQQIRI